MLKELVQYLEKRPAPVITEHDGRKFSDKELYKIANASPETIETTTLQSVVDFIVNGIDDQGSFALQKHIIHIQSPTHVSLITELVKDGSRWDRVSAKAIVPSINFGRFSDTEMFNIALQSMFVDTENRQKVLSIVGNITDGTVTGYKDDGVSQSVNIKAGVQRVGTANVPNPVSLAPYRTFAEVEQPESPFVLRLQSGSRDGDLPTAALFEADGAAWRLKAIQNIREYFEDRLLEYVSKGIVVIIA